MEHACDIFEAKRIPFLDIELGFDGDGNLQYDLYQKPNAAQKFISSTSGHKASHLEHVPNSVSTRVARRSQTYEAYKRNLDKFPTIREKITTNLSSVWSWFTYSRRVCTAISAPLGIATPS